MVINLLVLKIQMTLMLVLIKINSRFTTQLFNNNSSSQEFLTMLVAVAFKVQITTLNKALQPNSECLVAAILEEWVVILVAEVVVLVVVMVALTLPRCSCQLETVMLIRSRLVVLATIMGTMPIATLLPDNPVVFLVLSGDKIIGIENEINSKLCL